MMRILSDILKDGLSREQFYVAVKKRMREHSLKESGNFDQKVRYINSHLQDTRSEILASAEQAMKGLLVLPGTGGAPFFIGNPPLWIENQVNDKEFVWSLNRMNHWQPLLKAYHLTGDISYAKKVLEELLDWIDHCPCPDIDVESTDLKERFNSVNPWRSLEAGIRISRNWNMVLELLWDSEVFTPETLEKFALSVYEHAEVLYIVCPHIWPNADHNHYLTECLGLLSAACLFPEFKKSEEWKLHAIHELERCSEKQLTQDGGQIEGCPHYHNVCMDEFSKALYFARKHGFAFSDLFMNRLSKGFWYSIYSMRPTGTFVPWGDSDANQVAIRIAVTAYIAFNSTLWLDTVAKFISIDKIQKECEKQIWDISNIEKLLEEIDSNKSIDTPLLTWQKELKQVVIRTSWDSEAMSIFFACRTPVRNGHAHIDPMSFDFTALGRTLLVDPGRFTYREGEDRRAFKSATYHNTLLINNKEPFDYVSSWAFTPQKYGDITNIYETKDIMAVEAEHWNYEPIIHKRLLAMVEQSFVLVLDQVRNLQEDTSVQIYYHIDSQKVTNKNEEGFAYTKDSQSNIAIFYSKDLKASLLEGRVADEIDIMHPSKRLLLEEISGKVGTRHFMEVLVPYKDGSSPILEGLSIDNFNGDEAIYSFSLNEKRYRFIWGSNKLEVT